MEKKKNEKQSRFMDYETGIKDEKYQKLKDYALKLLSIRPRSCREIRERLQKYSTKKNISLSKLERVLVDLKSQKFLDDEEFATWWIEQRQSFRPLGRSVIEIELKRKGLDKESINRAFTSKNWTNEKENLLATKALIKKLKFYKNLPKKKQKLKLSQFLARRGFDWETIQSVVDSLVEKE